MSSKPLRCHRVSPQETARRQALIQQYSHEIGPQFALTDGQARSAHGLTFGTAAQSSRAVVYDDSSSAREIHTLAERPGSDFLSRLCASRLDRRAQLSPTAITTVIVVNDDRVDATTFDASPYGWVMCASPVAGLFAVIIGTEQTPNAIRLTLAG